MDSWNLHGPVVVFKQMPSHVLPETTPLDVFIQDKCITFFDALIRKARKALVHKRPSHTLTPEFPYDRKMT